MNLKEALKAAIDGKKIRRASKAGYIRWFDGALRDNYGSLVEFKGEWETATDWEIVHEPVKYSVELWFGNAPSQRKDGDILDYILCGFGRWNRVKSEWCQKKYRVTVEELPDGE